MKKFEVECDRCDALIPVVAVTKFADKKTETIRLHISEGHIREITPAPATSEWISIADGWPDSDDCRYVLSTSGGAFFSVMSCSAFRSLAPLPHLQVRKITHWMLIPVIDLAQTDDPKQRDKALDSRDNKG